MSIQSFFKDSLVFRQHRGRDAHNEPLTPEFTDTAIKGRAIEQQRNVTTVEGEEDVSTMTIWISNRTVTNEDKITYEGVDYSVLTMFRPKDRSGKVHHLELNCQ